MVIPMPTFPDEIMSKLAIFIVLAVIVLPFIEEYPRDVVRILDAVRVETIVRAFVESVFVLIVLP